MGEMRFGLRYRRVTTVTRNKKEEVGDQRSKVGGQRSEGRGRRWHGESTLVGDGGAPETEVAANAGEETENRGDWDPIFVLKRLV